MNVFKQLLLIGFVSIVLALAFNQWNVSGISILEFNPVQSVIKEAAAENLPTITMEEAWRHFEEGTAVFVDARPRDVFAQGRVEGAFSIPEHEIAESLPAFSEMIPTFEKVIVYCDGEECLASLHVANSLRENGYEDVVVFFGGWKHWLDAGYRVEWD